MARSFLQTVPNCLHGGEASPKVSVNPCPKCVPSLLTTHRVINYHGDSIVAIPGATKKEHVLQNIGAMTLKLSRDEMSKLDSLSRMIMS